MKILIIGASGTIGSAVVDKLRKLGHEVQGISRKSQPSIDIENPGSIEAFFSNSEPFDAIVCIAGDARFGALDQISEEDFMIGIKSKLMGQVHVCRYGMKKLSPTGRVVLTGGILAHQPWPETTSVAMVNAALEGFVKALALELEENQRALVVHPPLVRESAIQMGMNGEGLPSADEVATAYVQALTTDSNGKAIFYES